ncbi:hypothetical protein [Phenylobacterium sp. J367]|uniref:hypothetical protein n=1 Tax=Phenylobacterium sp. J367 TaxID=2898435 RepID=UPI0021508D44|nr:hypothetical protein [Phenylobacterium sp. J367]MCR5880151.1 hypothetical protein [Phenylobacterium sp. J367]
MLWNWLAALAAAVALQTTSAAAREVVETADFSCNPGDEAVPPSSFVIRGALASAHTIRIVRGPRLLPTRETVQWCRNLYDPRVRGPVGCRNDGPSVTTGTLELTVIETIIGEPAEMLEIRLKGGANGAFIGEFVSDDPQAVCTYRNRVETIDGETYLSPTLFGLDPSREFLLTVGADTDGRPLVAAWGLSAQSEPFKQFLRDAARARRQILDKRSQKVPARSE